MALVHWGDLTAAIIAFSKGEKYLSIGNRIFIAFLGVNQILKTAVFHQNKNHIFSLRNFHQQIEVWKKNLRYIALIFGWNIARKLIFASPQGTIDNMNELKYISWQGRRDLTHNSFVQTSTWASQQNFLPMKETASISTVNIFLFARRKVDFSQIFQVGVESVSHKLQVIDETRLRIH